MLPVHVPSGGQSTLTFTSRWLWNITHSQTRNRHSRYIISIVHGKISSRRRPMHQYSSVSGLSIVLCENSCSTFPQVDMAKMHVIFCKDGDNVCGSSRIHHVSLREMIDRVIESHTACKPEGKEIKHKYLRSALLTD